MSKLAILYKYFILLFILSPSQSSSVEEFEVLFLALNICVKLGHLFEDIPLRVNSYSLRQVLFIYSNRFSPNLAKGLRADHNREVNTTCG